MDQDKIRLDHIRLQINKVLFAAAGSAENLYEILLVKLVRRDLQEWLQAGIGGVIHQQVDGANVLQRLLRGPPVCQVHAHRRDGRTL